jgi:galactonate dehydratase
MKIAKIGTTVVSGGRRNWIFVRVDTDEPGLYGWGEATLEWKTKTIVGAVEDLSELLIGMDPRDIARVVERAKKHSFWPLGAIGMTALSGIEQALWDIYGKSLNLPVWRLLGGQCRDRVRVYTHIGFGRFPNPIPADIERYVEGTQKVIERGYDAIKFNPMPHTGYHATLADVRNMAELMERLRAAAGETVDLMVDFLGRPASVSAAVEYIRAMAPARLMWVEEPIEPGDPDAFRAIADRVDVPLATGERLVTLQEFADLARSNGVSFAQPDLCHCGGLLEGQRIAAVCAAGYVGVAPHNPGGPISSVVGLHFAVGTPNFVILEEMTGSVPWYWEVVRYPTGPENGYWELPEGPGLGVEIDLKAAAQHPFTKEEPTATPAFLSDNSITAR